MLTSTSCCLSHKFRRASQCLFVLEDGYSLKSCFKVMSDWVEVCFMVTCFCHLLLFRVLLHPSLLFIRDMINALREIPSPWKSISSGMICCFFWRWVKCLFYDIKLEEDIAISSFTFKQIFSTFCCHFMLASTTRWVDNIFWPLGLNLKCNLTFAWVCFCKPSAGIFVLRVKENTWNLYDTWHNTKKEIRKKRCAKRVTGSSSLEFQIRVLFISRT